MPVYLTPCIFFFKLLDSFGCLMGEKRSQKYQIPTSFVEIGAFVEERTRRITLMPILFVCSLQDSQNMHATNQPSESHTLLLLLFWK